MKPSDQIRYSEAFKQQVVSEIASGKFAGPFAAGRAYGIKGADTVSRWLREYGRSDLMPRRITITSMEEQDEKKALKQRVRELERALADAHMKGLLDDAYLGIACQRLGLDVADFKKKHVTKLSEQPSRSEPKREP
jgi:transposase-like protein